MGEINFSGIAMHLGEIAQSLSDIGAQYGGDGRYIGMEAAALEALEHLMTAMFPYHLSHARTRFVENEKRTWELMRTYDALVRAIGFVKDEKGAEKCAMELIDALPEIQDFLRCDIWAAYQGDPAAISTDEVILTYPAFKAICIYRIAHKLYQMEVPILPRMMTEYAHRITGIDIHPGASIGRFFFIDHGTGVVIGETTTIGEYVKLYQHVTLGAKSFEVGDDGALVKGIKRHPDIGNRVVIYAGATILGGTTKIGDDCVIGGNVWLTHSLASGQTVTVAVQEKSNCK